MSEGNTVHQVAAPIQEKYKQLCQCIIEVNKLQHQIRTDVKTADWSSARLVDTKADAVFFPYSRPPKSYVGWTLLPCEALYGIKVVYGMHDEMLFCLDESRLQLVFREPLPKHIVDGFDHLTDVFKRDWHEYIDQNPWCHEFPDAYQVGSDKYYKRLFDTPIADQSNLILGKDNAVQGVKFYVAFRNKTS